MYIYIYTQNREIFIIYIYEIKNTFTYILFLFEQFLSFIKLKKIHISVYFYYKNDYKTLYILQCCIWMYTIYTYISSCKQLAISYFMLTLNGVI